jgi:hypothetical protein
MIYAIIKFHGPVTSNDNWLHDYYISTIPHGMIIFDIQEGIA